MKNGVVAMIMKPCLLNLSSLTNDADLTNVKGKPSTGLCSASLTGLGPITQI